MARINRRQFIRYSSLSFASSLVASCNNPNQNQSDRPSAKMKRVVFGTNWYAQAEHGGFYQAVATGIYQARGLDVAIKIGGPQINGTQLLMGRAVDFFMGFGGDAIKAVEAEIPKITVAAIFQKNPLVLIAHPHMGIKSLEDLKGKPIYVSAVANTTFWPFLKAKYGFSDIQKRPYNYNVVPFITDKESAQQGYLSSEPLKIEDKGGFKPVVFLLADYGYNPYATTIETRQELVNQQPDLVQDFVDASIQGWYSYLENPEPGNKLIKKDNPQMTDKQLRYSLQKMIEHGIVTSEGINIGNMTEARWQSFFETQVKAGVFNSNTDYKKAFTLKFINKNQK